MRYALHLLKCVLVSLVAALGTLVVAVLVVVLLDVVMHSVAVGERVSAIMTGGLAAVSPSLEPAVAAMVVGAVAGFWVTLGHGPGRTHRVE